MTNTLQNQAFRRLVLTCALCAVAVGGVYIATLKNNSWASAAPAHAASVSKQGVDDSGEYDSKLDNPNKVYTVTIRDEKKVGGPAVVRVKLGDSVRINIKALGHEEANVVLPDFGVRTESDPSDPAPGGLLFIADKPGTFKYYMLDEHDKTKKTEIGTVVIK
jgi:nitrous oxide reductase